MQKRGSNLVGSLFGPVMTLWLLSVAALGVYGLLRHPEVVAAANPRWAVEYLAHNGFKGFASLGAVVLVMTGGEALHAEGKKLVDFIDDQQDGPPLQAPGTAVFLTGDSQWAPQPLRHNVEHNHVLHERNVVLTVAGMDQPRTRGDERSDVKELEHGFWRVTLRFGFAESIDVPARLRQLKLDPTLEADKLVWFLGHDKVSAEDDKSYRMARWRARLFAWMARNATPATTYYGIPPRRLIEIGARIDL